MTSPVLEHWALSFLHPRIAASGPFLPPGNCLVKELLRSFGEAFGNDLPTANLRGADNFTQRRTKKGIAHLRYGVGFFCKARFSPCRCDVSFLRGGNYGGLVC